jgi:hypothetical protein
LLGALHRIALDGRAPALARHYPSTGGEPGDTMVADALATMAEHRAEVSVRLTEQVQTNEVARACALVGGFAEVSRRFRRPLALAEIGASAGLLLRWDRYRYDTGAQVAGDPDAALVFRGHWTVAPDLSGLAPVAERGGCDIAPLDASDPNHQLRLLSFVWPDQVSRLERLRTALHGAAGLPVAIERADAGDWLAARLPHRPAGVATVVYHAIVWQYLPRRSQDAVRSALARHGADARADTPLAWLRMEPAGPVADLRLTTWPGGHEEVLGTSGYHGTDVVWGTV